MSIEKPTTENKLVHSILTRIEAEHVKPMPKYWFLCRECMTWVLWVASVLLGALAVAVICFVATHNRYAFYEATHATPFTFVVEALPYVWILLFIGLSVLAYSNLRKTKKGYKYPFAKIIGSSLVFSIIGGVALHIAGVGFLVDTELGKQMGVYRSQEKVERGVWQSPHEGRLIGILATGTREAVVVSFTDTSGTTWQFDTSELRKPDIDQLFSERTVRVLGVPVSSSTVFHACGVFPWMLDKNMSGEELSGIRRQFEERIYAHTEIDARRVEFQEKALAGRVMGLCAELASAKRMRAKMKQ